MKYILLLIFFLNVADASAQHYAPHKWSKDSITFLTKEKLLEDIDVYANGVARNHVNAFTVIKKSTFFDEIQKIKDSAAYMNVDVMLVRLMKVNAMLQDEHTSIGYVSRDVFPLNCYWFDEGVFVTATDASNKAALHARVISVNGMPIGRVADEIGTLSADKNLPGIKIKLQHSLFDPFIIHGLQIAPSRNDIVYTIVQQGGDTVNIHPVAVDRRSVSLNNHKKQNTLRAMNNLPHWFRYEDVGNYMYLKYGSCYDKDKEHQFDDIESRLEEEMERRKPGKIIIDLRDNGGGYTRHSRKLLRYLVTCDQNKKGRIYVLIGRRTFSAGILTSVAIKNLTYAQLIGEETSGSVAHYGNVKFFDLPATALKVMYSTAYVATDERYDGSLRPDIIVPNAFSDYIKDIDAALEYAIYH